jgi:hypothetical protein
LKKKKKDEDDNEDDDDHRAKNTRSILLLHPKLVRVFVVEQSSSSRGVCFGERR